MLRSTPKYVADKEIPEMLRKWNFFEREQNWNGEFPNDFVAQDLTVFDRTTGLIWTSNIFKDFTDFTGARLLIKSLNKIQYAGYRDWRLPTLEEAASLLFWERRDVDLMFIDPVFPPFWPHRKLTGSPCCLLTADYFSSGKKRSDRLGIWRVTFSFAQLSVYHSSDFGSLHPFHVRPCRSHASPAGLSSVPFTSQPQREFPPLSRIPVPQPDFHSSRSSRTAATPASNQNLPASPVPSRIGRRPEYRQTITVPFADDDVPQIILLADR